jgi:starvation-inducible outer membrane lipoprotein
MNKIIVQGLLVLSLIVAGCSSVPELTKKEKAVNRILTLDSLTCDERVWLIEAVMQK